MGSVLSAVQCLARTVYGWGVQCYKAATSFAKSIWQSFTDTLSKLIDLLGDAIKSIKSCFMYSDHTTSATIRRDQNTRYVEVRETKIRVKAGYNCDDNEEEHDPIKEEKKKNLERMKEIQQFVNETVEIMESDVESDEDPAASGLSVMLLDIKEKTVARVKNLMDGQNARKILDYAEKRSIPRVL